ncbi:unnamed protein product, partial [Symbiodinium pilosum]
PEGTYYVHDNGGRPFKVEVRWPCPKAEVKVFKMALDGREGDAENNEGLPAYEKQASLILSAERVFIGQCPKRGASFDGNSMLLHLEGMKYVFVGVLVFSFTSTSRITKYASLVGNNDVPYPWAIDEQGRRYLMTSSVILDSKLFEDIDTDPYNCYFDRLLMTAHLGTVPPQQPLCQFQSITEFWVGEKQYTLKHQPHPEIAFEELAKIGELSVVKGGSRTKLSKAEFVKLMQDYANEMGLETLRSLTLIERLE